MFHGQGELIHANGDIYKGQFVDNKKCGKGKLVFHKQQKCKQYVG